VEPPATCDGECTLATDTIVISTPTHSRLGWSLVALLALILGGASLTLASEGANEARKPAVAQSSPGERLPIPRRAFLVPGEQFATDSSAAGGADLWAFARVGSGLRVQRWQVTSSAISPQPASLMTSPPAGSLNVAVAPWRGTRQALVLATQQGRSIAVQVRRAVPPFAILGQARTPTLPLQAGDVRSVFVDSDARGSADLVVVDRPATVAGAMRIRVLRGETDFQSVTRDVQLGTTNSWPRPEWNLVVGGVDSMSDDLLFISQTQPTQTGKIEVHALLSASGYHGYGTQTPINSPEGSGVDWSFALAHGYGGVPVLYGIDLTSRLLMRFSL
jgi:hypothetical protein